jgi:dipeptide transport system permease protein
MTLLRRLLRQRVPASATILLVIFVVLGVLAPLIAPHGPEDADLARRLAPGFWSPDAARGYLLGTDSLGRDLLSRLLYGARASMVMALAPVAISLVVGILLGLLSLRSQVLDDISMRIMDLVLAFPALLLALAIVAALGPGAVTAIVAIAITDIPRVARLARGQVMAVRQQEYIMSALSVGAGTARLAARHVIPNIISVIVVYSSLQAGRALLTVAGLGYLGLGVRAPTPEWGSMLSDSRQLMLSGAWEPVALPGLAILVTVLAFNLVGDGLRDALDPRLS